MTRLIAITGGSGAGKTTVAEALAARLGADATLIAEDDYYRCSSNIRDFDPGTFNFDEPAAKDDALLKAHLEAARRGEAFERPNYNLKTHTRETYTTRIAPTPIVIVEGIHLLVFADLRACFDLTVYMDAEDALRLGRRMIRDVEKRGRKAHSVFHQFFTHVHPMHQRHVAPQRAHADLVLVSAYQDGAREAEAHADVILARLNDLS